MSLISLGIGLSPVMGGGGAALPTINLSANSVNEDAVRNTAIGTLSMSAGVGYSFTLTASANGIFGLTGASNASLILLGLVDNGTASSYQITVSASNGGTPIVQDFTVNISAVADRATTTFTSAGDGNWNALATWTNGTDYPRLAGDTVTIAAGHEVTIPAGPVHVGAITVNAGTNTTTNRTKLIQGTGALYMHGNATFATISSHEMAAGSLIDLQGNTITWNATDILHTYTGTANAHVTVQSTGARGIITVNGGIVVTATWNYVDCSGLADSVFGRSHTSAMIQHYDHCTFTDMEDFAIDATSTNVNAGFRWNHCDVRAPHAPTGTDYQPRLTQANQALGTAPREIKFSTWKGAAGRIGALQLINTTGVTFEDNILENYRLYHTGTSANITPKRCMFFCNEDLDVSFFDTGNVVFGTVDENYFYYNGTIHPFGQMTSGGTWQNNVMESTGLGTNWALWSTFGGTTLWQNNIMLGKGILLTFTGAAAPTLTAQGNTIYYSNNDIAFPAILLTEQSGALTGTVTIQNNLLVDSNTTAGPESNAYMRTNTAAQIDTGNFNGKAGYNGSGVYTATNFPYYENNGAGQIAGLGANDIQADPLFADKSCNLAAWDASLGGAGTAVHAIAELLKLNGTGGTYNSAYNPSAAIDYVFAGFTPTGAGATAYNGTGAAGANIGARPF